MKVEVTVHDQSVGGRARGRDWGWWRARPNLEEVGPGEVEPVGDLRGQLERRRAIVPTMVRSRTPPWLSANISQWVTVQSGWWRGKMGLVRSGVVQGAEARAAVVQGQSARAAAHTASLVNTSTMDLALESTSFGMSAARHRSTSAVFRS